MIWDPCHHLCSCWSGAGDDDHKRSSALRGTMQCKRSFLDVDSRFNEGKNTTTYDKYIFAHKLPSIVDYFFFRGWSTRACQTYYVQFYSTYFLLLIKSLTEAGRPQTPWQTMRLYEEAQELVAWMADRTSHIHKASTFFSEGEILRRIFDYGLRWLYPTAQHNG